MHKILIENATFHAFHGVHEEESVLGTKFSIDLELTTDFSKAASEDDIEGTVNYSAVYSLLEKEVQQPSKLIEHLAQRIIDCLKSNFTSISKVSIKVSKWNPPISGGLEKVSVVIEE